MKRSLVCCFGLLLVGALLIGLSAPRVCLAAAASPATGASVAPKTIDDFEDGSFRANPPWWTFDRIVVKIVKPADTDGSGLGKYIMTISGKAQNWYVGGMGVSLGGVDATKYDAIQVDIKGSGLKSGKLKFELYEDDNNNGVIEQDPANNYAPTSDDKWVYEQTIDWEGWKTVAIPLTEFYDDNPGVGNDTWDPDQKGDSGGLINFQLIVIGASKDGEVNLAIDNIKLIKRSDTVIKTREKTGK